ncbi:GNAT family N-acetyltransferase [Paenibacillus radicis (ex Xue et al. 2023)]|uniref:GNAT family N-acetyltransferase n=1 Tax=Paenibacillus radicis (ex Xue et al. 2023) TaxID=2972489 RepID=A0ABT1YEZ9_9BACL|nr:GNAT family N-acetyltransferase [Paenibacillus radicis (ex Xue et al. 2023)]MCR8631295.1 GNAT family N-acetyltransferase [Paenibacillus radicis (ex Xue et al. 2023)]
MEIQKVSIEDYSAILTLFKEVKAELNKQRNDQWKWLYPNRSTHKTDIKNGTMYGIKENNSYVAAITLDDLQSEKYKTLNWKDNEGKACCIHRLAVHPKQQGRGLGKKLLHYAEHLAHNQGYTSVRIDVYQTNAAAVALYEKNGYEKVGEVRYPLRKHSYISMEKQFT